MKCDECGAESAGDFGYVNLRTGLTKKKTLCVTCLRYKRHQSGNRVIKDFLFGLVFASIFLLNQAAPWFFLNLYLFLAMSYLSIIPHEFGHALGAILTRLRLVEISIGKGRRLFHTKLCGVYLGFCIAPVEGHVRALHTSGRVSRLKGLMLTAMGPAANLILFFVLWNGLQDAIARESIYKSPAPLFTFALANLVMGIWNLLPFKYQSANGPMVSDGLRILTTVFTRKTEPVDATAQLHFHAHIAFQYKDYEACKTLSERALAENEHDAWALNNYAVAVAGLGDRTSAIALLVRLLKLPDVDEKIKALAQSNLAYFYLVTDDQPNFSNALELAEEAMRYMPWDLSVRSNYGGTQIMAGDVQKGLSVLTDKRYELRPKADQADISCLLAIGLSKIGQFDLAKQHLARARKLDSDCVFISRAEKTVTT